jgi:hypothetical protein
MPRRLAAWLQVRILSAGSVGSSGANQLPFGAGLFQPALVVHGDRILNRWIPLCWALWYGNASRPFSCCGMVLLLAELRRFVPSSCSRIAVKPRPNVGPAPDQGPIIPISGGFFGRRGNRPFLALRHRCADGLNWCYRKPRRHPGDPNLRNGRFQSEYAHGWTWNPSGAGRMVHGSQVPIARDGGIGPLTCFAGTKPRFACGRP